MKYKIYYANGETRTDKDELLPLGVIGIVNVFQSKNAGWWLSSKRDYYVLVDDCEWWSVDFAGMLLYLQTHIGKASVLFGQLVSNEQWTEFFQALKVDPDLPHKSNKMVGEIGEDGTTVS